MITTAYEEKNMMKEPNIMIRRLKPIEMLGFVPFILPLHYITLDYEGRKTHDTQIREVTH